MSASAQRGPYLLFADLGGHVPDRHQSVLVVTVTTLVIATIFVAARLVSRLLIVRKITWDDYFIVFGWVSFICKASGSSGSARCDALTVLNLYANWNLGRFLLLDSHFLLHMVPQKDWGCEMPIFQKNGCTHSGSANMPLQYSTSVNSSVGKIRTKISSRILP
jgi:hypothetical protein